MFFFPIFWTAFIPFFIAIFSLVAEWLMHLLRQRRAHSFAPVGRDHAASPATVIRTTVQHRGSAMSMTASMILIGQLIAGAYSGAGVHDTQTGRIVVGNGDPDRSILRSARER
jgi:hypothetical protein